MHDISTACTERQTSRLYDFSVFCQNRNKIIKIVWQKNDSPRALYYHKMRQHRIKSANNNGSLCVLVVQEAFPFIPFLST